MSEDSSSNAPPMTDRFTRAVEYARDAHDGQFRKGTKIPYLSHVLGVACLVLDHGGDEDQAIAALLHDVVEDCGSHHEQVIIEQFGDRVAMIVMACTDGTREEKAAAKTVESKKQNWLHRKTQYLKDLEQAPDEVLLVSGCDKLHNARAILADLANPDVGQTVFDRFSADTEGTLWYYRSIADLHSARESPVARQLEAVVKAMEQMSR